VEPEEELSRASEAEAILKNPRFADAVKEVENALLEGIKRSAFKDSELREKLCQQLINLHSVVGQLRNYLETGRLAEETIKQRNLAQRAKDFLGGAYR